jgi:hypothetical protein
MSGTRDTRTIDKESLQWGFPSIITFCLQVYILLEENITNIDSSFVKRGSVAGISIFHSPLSHSFWQHFQLHIDNFC